MKVSYDPVADAATIYLTEARIGISKQTIPFDINDHMFAFDFDNEGKLVSIEILGASQVLPEALLKASSQPRRPP